MLCQSLGVFSTHFTTQTSATITTVKGNSDSQNPVVVDENGKLHCRGLRSYCLMQDQNQLPCSYSPTSRNQCIMNHHQRTWDYCNWPIRAIFSNQFGYPMIFQPQLTGKTPSGSPIPSSWASGEFPRPGRSWTPPNGWGNLPLNLGASWLHDIFVKKSGFQINVGPYWRNYNMQFI